MGRPTNTRKEALPIPEEAHAPVAFTPSDSAALRALASGEANQLQQKQVLDWIINHVCRTYDQPYRPGEDGRRATDFACGRQFAGQQLVRVLKWAPPQRKDEEENGRADQR